MQMQSNRSDSTERQTDKEWLLSDLRERLDSAYLRLPRKTGLMRQVTEEGVARFQRLIAMVQEIAERSTETTPDDELALDMLCAMRPSVSRWVFADFMAGRSPRTPYLHVDPAEFRRIIGWMLAEQDVSQDFANRELGGRSMPLDRLPAPEPEYDDDLPF